MGAAVITTRRLKRNAWRHWRAATGRRGSSQPSPAHLSTPTLPLPPHSCRSYGSTVQLLNVTQPLGGAGRELAAGQYQWPIVFALPPGLPSSFRIGAGSEGYVLRGDRLLACRVRCGGWLQQRLAVCGKAGQETVGAWALGPPCRHSNRPTFYLLPVITQPYLFAAALRWRSAAT